MAATHPTITSNLSLLSDGDLTRATDRAYREAARCWAEYRANPSGDVGRMLLTSAEAAEDWFETLREEQERRDAAIPSGAFVATGYADRMDLTSTDSRDYATATTSPWVRNAQSRSLPVRVTGGRSREDLAS